MEPVEKYDEEHEDIIENVTLRLSSYQETTNEGSLRRRKEDIIRCLLAIILGTCAQKKS